MQLWIPWIIAVASLALSGVLWFREVNRIMRNRKSTVDSAGGQLEICRKKVAIVDAAADAKAVLDRSEQIYNQAVAQYNQAIHKPWIMLPALLMGYHSIG